MEKLLRKGIREAVRSLYGAGAGDDLLQIQKTRKEFEGDYHPGGVPACENLPPLTGTDCTGAG
jgi:hypothetical protein